MRYRITKRAVTRIRPVVKHGMTVPARPPVAWRKAQAPGKVLRFTPGEPVEKCNECQKRKRGKGGTQEACPRSGYAPAQQSCGHIKTGLNDY